MADGSLVSLAGPWDVGCCVHGHPKKSCEDTYLIKSGSPGTDSGLVLGVLDGVGGTRVKGSPLSVVEFVSSLAKNVTASLEMPCWDSLQLRDALRDGAAATTLPGASTACLVGIGPDLRSACAFNVGDSGFALLRGGTSARVVLTSCTQQFYWNCPAQVYGGGGGACESVLSGGDAINFEVEPGDVLVLGSDGLFDNMYMHELAALVRGRFAAAAAAGAAAAAARGKAGPRRRPGGRAGGGGAAGASVDGSDCSGDEEDADGGSSTLSCASALSRAGRAGGGGSSSSSSSLSSVGGDCAGGGGGGGAVAPAGVPSAQELADALAGAARSNSTDPDYVSPFGLIDRAIRRHECADRSGALLLQPMGSGKVDDITCVVLVVPPWTPTHASAGGAPTASAAAAGEPQTLAPPPAQRPPFPPAWRQPGLLTWDKLAAARVGLRDAAVAAATSASGGPAVAAAAAAAGAPADAQVEAWVSQHSACRAASIEAAAQPAAVPAGAWGGDECSAPDCAGGWGGDQGSAVADCGWGAVEPGGGVDWGAVEPSGGADWGAAAAAAAGVAGQEANRCQEQQGLESEQQEWQPEEWPEPEAPPGQEQSEEKDSAGGTVPFKGDGCPQEQEQQDDLQDDYVLKQESQQQAYLLGSRGSVFDHQQQEEGQRGLCQAWDLQRDPNPEEEQHTVHQQPGGCERAVGAGGGGAASAAALALEVARLQRVVADLRRSVCDVLVETLRVASAPAPAFDNNNGAAGWQSELLPPLLRAPPPAAAAVVSPEADASGADEPPLSPPGGMAAVAAAALQVCSPL